MNTMVFREHRVTLMHTVTAMAAAAGRHGIMGDGIRTP